RRRSRRHDGTGSVEPRPVTTRNDGSSARRMPGHGRHRAGSRTSARAAAGRMLGPTRALAAAATAVVLDVTGGGWCEWTNDAGDVSTAHALGEAGASDGGKRNILIMGLDSRLDKNGDPLPQEVYDRLHAGDEGGGGYDANTLLLLHIPESGDAARI